MTNIARAILGIGHNPIYVQFYITSRCNLTCKQCNIIYANADVREATTEEVDQIAQNLKEIGTAIVLLTGGEPFIRKDLPSIVRSFTSRGIHVRNQTNGLATQKQMEDVVTAGACDISISLDSLLGGKQDFLNGSYDETWLRAIKTIALVTQTYPARDGFAVLGTVLSPHNILEIPNIIRFATRTGWYVSLVPAHISDPTEVFNFRSYDREMQFIPDEYPIIDEIIAECTSLKKQGYHLYDSIEYLENIKLFLKGEGVTWRRKNSGRCDSPELYFAIRPNGDMQVCCDHILYESYPVWHEDFPKWYREKVVHREIHPITESCSGCMYGSFPEISITAHYPLTTLERVGVFLKTNRKKPWPLTTEQLLDIVDDINKNYPVDHSLMTARLESVATHADATTLIPVTSLKRIVS